MKTVFSNTDQCIHVWAQQNQHNGRNSTSSISFEGETLVSYSTPIARFVRNKKGALAVLHYCGSYSVTTSAQQSAAYQATAQYKRFRVNYLGDNCGYGRASAATGDYRKANLADYAQRYGALLEKTSRCRSGNAIDHGINELERLKKEAREYAGFFGLRFAPSKFPEPNRDRLETVKQAFRKKEAEKKAENEKRLEEKRKNFSAHIEGFLAGKDTSLNWQWETFATADQKKRVRKYSEYLWRAYGTAPRHGLGNDVLLRTRKRIVETSQGAQFPIADAKKVWPIIQRVKKSGEQDHEALGCTLGSFAINRIFANGDVRAGCHLVKYDEIERLAKQLKIA